MATHNVNNGTGGLDGSLVYELDRPEVCHISFYFLLVLRGFAELWFGLQPDYDRF